jgi:hypothetical protein
MHLDELRATAERDFPDDPPLLIGCGLIPGEMPLEPAAGTTVGFTSFNPDDLESIRPTKSLQGRIFPLRSQDPKSAKITLGRRRGNDVHIPDFPVSQSHCYFGRYPEGLALIDDESTNGTCVNGKTLKPGVPELLHEGDIVSMGRFAFRWFPSVSAALAHSDPSGPVEPPSS